MRTLGRRIIQLTPAGGFAAQTVASSVMVTTATVFAVPVSTTHITTTSIMGVGSTRRLSAVRWGVAGNIVVAWIVTLPAAGAVAAVAYFLTDAVGRLRLLGVTGARPADPVALGTAQGRWLVVVTVLASGMAFLDATAVQVALPAIGRDLDASLSGLQWTISGYTLALASLILLGGSLGDRYGRRRVFLVGRRLVRRGLAALRARPDHRPAGRRPRAAGHRRRAAHPGQPGPHPVLVPARRPGPGDRPVVGAGRHRRA